ncbi:MAG TPA: hypothetical protein VGC92_08725 [Phenylobacterium sp.]|jgi:hypothetical protein
MSKYQPLTERLAGQAGAEWRATFAELEALLGSALPKTARTGRAWWKTGPWTEAGWTAEADTAAGAVVFRRAAAEPAGEPSAQLPVPADEPPILRRLEVGPGWGTALVLGGVAVLAGIGALVMRGVLRKKG